MERGAEMKPYRTIPRWLAGAARLLLVLLTLPPFAFGAAFRVEGVVHDSSGASIPSASVTLTSAEFTSSRVTDPSGFFSFGAVPHASGTLEVQAPGFAVLKQSWNADLQGVA